MSNSDDFVQHQQMLHQQQSTLLNNMQNHLNDPNVDSAELLTTLTNMMQVMDARSNSLSAQYSQASRFSSLSDAVNIVQAQNQEALLQQNAMIASMQEVVHQLSEKAVNHSHSSSQRLHIPHPFTPGFNGDTKTLSFRAFKAKLNVVFQRFENAFSTDNQRINYALSCMSGPPLEHLAPIFNKDVADTEGLLKSYDTFMNSIDAAYGDRLSIQEAEDKIRFLKQKGTMQEYISEFATLQGRIRWNQDALVSQFKFGLSESVRVLLQNQWHSLTTMKEVSEAATTAYQNLRVGGSRRPFNQNVWPRPGQQHRPSQPHRPSPPAAAPGPNDMELGAMRGPLTAQEKERRRKDRLCLYCGQANHFANSCPNKKPSVGFSLVETDDGDYVFDLQGKDQA